MKKNRVCPSSTRPLSADSELRSTARQIQSKSTEFVCPSSPVRSPLARIGARQPDRFSQKVHNSSVHHHNNEITDGSHGHRRRIWKLRLRVVVVVVVARTPEVAVVPYVVFSDAKTIEQTPALHFWGELPSRQNLKRVFNNCRGKKAVIIGFSGRWGIERRWVVVRRWKCVVFNNNNA
jgi:hypothetical protein